MNLKDLRTFYNSPPPVFFSHTSLSPPQQQKLFPVALETPAFGGARRGSDVRNRFHPNPRKKSKIIETHHQPVTTWRKESKLKEKEMRVGGESKNATVLQRWSQLKVKILHNIQHMKTPFSLSLSVKQEMSVNHGNL